ncbi:MAG TPA: hypothetical protein VL172_08550 [Kofleriaceae bacterium]|nr:hypothetical protein [Kofleriaceae bacterium]
MRRSGAVGILLLSACGYQAGSLRPTPAGRVVQVNCLDVRVEPLADAEATGAAFTYTFGNRCDRLARVDLGAIEAVGRFADGHRVVLAAYDPDHVIHAGVLVGRRAGAESIEYQDPDHPDARPVEVCLALGAITGGGAQPPIECLAVQP